ncbi:MAG: M1 family metallopeptidase [Bacteroidota bacterium]
MTRLIFIIVSIFIVHNSSAQVLNKKTVHTHQDTLRGSITPEREWWDLTYYHLDIEVKPEEKYISGTNTIQYKVLKPYQLMQIDLQPPLKITKVLQSGNTLQVEHKGNAHFIKLSEKQSTGDVKELEVSYEGNPHEAIRAPWDGGITWEKDKNGNHFVASSCQGIGASIWWPNKDHMYDEVDSMLISVTNPKGLTNVSNGRLRKIEENADTVTSHWFVSNPINNYGVNINIGDYVKFSELYNGKNGQLDMDFWVLSYNLEKAKKHFKDVPRTIEAFEHWFGPYPFYEDSYKLVEVPYLGMEHQSSVTYGNQYRKGYLGGDLSGTGWGLKFDFIIVHETGHEWFANSITNQDIADMWIHESFTAYSESLFLEYHYSKAAGADYVIGTRARVQNDKPLIGIYGVNQEGSGDMYYKGANMLHTLRNWIDNDQLWHQILKGLNKEFYHQTVTSKQIESYISKRSKKDLTGFFNQYLRDDRIPTLEYQIQNKNLSYRYIDIVEDFKMPIKVVLNNVEQWLSPSKDWKSIELSSNSLQFEVNRNFYVNSKLTE